MTARIPSPLVGFNNNVRYRGMSFHIQTEDSGLGRPFIVTHLFADGGRVIKTLRVDYSEHVQHPDYRATVQRLMRDQHKAMAYELRKGKVDSIIDALMLRPPPPDAALRSGPPPGSLDISAERPAPARALEMTLRPVELTRPPVEMTLPPLEMTLPPPATLLPLAQTPLPPAPVPSTLRSVFGALPPVSLDHLILDYIASAAAPRHPSR